MIVKEYTLYPDRKDVTLTAYIIGEKGELHVQGKRPAVLICPGGAYFGCSDRESEPVALAFAAMGYHAFVLRYSTWLEGEAGFPDFVHFQLKPHLAHPAPVREIGMAMLLIRKNSGRWMVDTDRIAVCGFSAGAHNAAMYGVYWNKPLITEYLEIEPEQIRPAVLILSYTLSDYVYMKRRTMNLTEQDREFFEKSTMTLLGKETFTEEDLEQVSPARLTDRDTPPAFLWATSTDHMVPVQHSLRMVHSLAEAGVPFELHLYEGGEHGLSLATQASSVAKDQINETASQWIHAAEKWLQKRFALNLTKEAEYEQTIVWQEQSGHCQDCSVKESRGQPEDYF